MGSDVDVVDRDCWWDRRRSRRDVDSANDDSNDSDNDSDDETTMITPRRSIATQSQTTYTELAGHRTPRFKPLAVAEHGAFLDGGWERPAIERRT